MIVLSRKKGESIIVGDSIVFTIVDAREINGEIKVRVGVEAPREVPIHRREVFEAIQRMNDSDNSPSAP